MTRIKMKDSPRDADSTTVPVIVVLADSGPTHENSTASPGSESAQDVSIGPMQTAAPISTDNATNAATVSLSNWTTTVSMDNATISATVSTGNSTTDFSSTVAVTHSQYLATLRFDNMAWSEAYNNTASDEYQLLKNQTEALMNAAFSNESSYLRSDVKRFRQGSIIAEIEITFDGRNLTLSELTDLLMNASNSDDPFWRNMSILNVTDFMELFVSSSEATDTTEDSTPPPTTPASSTLSTTEASTTLSTTEASSTLNTTTQVNSTLPTTQASSTLNTTQASSTLPTTQASAILHVHRDIQIEVKNWNWTDDLNNIASQEYYTFNKTVIEWVHDAFTNYSSYKMAKIIQLSKDYFIVSLELSFVDPDLTTEQIIVALKASPKFTIWNRTQDLLTTTNETFSSAFDDFTTATGSMEQFTTSSVPTVLVTKVAPDNVTSLNDTHFTMFPDNSTTATPTVTVLDLYNTTAIYDNTTQGIFGNATTETLYRNTTALISPDSVNATTLVQSNATLYTTTVDYVNTTMPVQNTTVTYLNTTSLFVNTTLATENATTTYANSTIVYENSTKSEINYVTTLTENTTMEYINTTSAYINITYPLMPNTTFGYVNTSSIENTTLDYVNTTSIYVSLPENATTHVTSTASTYLVNATSLIENTTLSYVNTTSLGGNTTLMAFDNTTDYNFTGSLTSSTVTNVTSSFIDNVTSSFHDNVTVTTTPLTKNFTSGWLSDNQTVVATVENTTSLSTVSTENTTVSLLINTTSVVVMDNTTSSMDNTTSSLDNTTAVPESTTLVVAHTTSTNFSESYQTLTPQYSTVPSDNSTLAIAPQKAFRLKMRITTMNWTEDYKNDSSEMSVTLRNQLISKLDELFKNFYSYDNSKIIGFSQGSVIVELTTTFSNTSVTQQQVQEKLLESPPLNASLEMISEE
ncbi:serine-rich adhesin for platelets, partial [Biomphalaria glabrata]